MRVFWSFCRCIPFCEHSLRTKKTELGTTTVIVAVKTKDGKASVYLKNKLKKFGLQIGFNKRYNLYMTTSKNGWQNREIFQESLPHIFPERNVDDIMILFLDGWTEFMEKEVHMELLLKFIYEKFFCQTSKSKKCKKWKIKSFRML